MARGPTTASHNIVVPHAIAAHSLAGVNVASRRNLYLFLAAAMPRIPRRQGPSELLEDLGRSEVACLMQKALDYPNQWEALCAGTVSPAMTLWDRQSGRLPPATFPGEGGYLGLELVGADIVDAYAGIAMCREGRFYGTSGAGHIDAPEKANLRYWMSIFSTSEAAVEASYQRRGKAMRLSPKVLAEGLRRLLEQWSIMTLRLYRPQRTAGNWIDFGEALGLPLAVRELGVGPGSNGNNSIQLRPNN